MYLTIYLIVLLYSVTCQCQIHAPCYTCVFYKLHHPQRTQSRVSADGACIFPCYCDVHILNCQSGVKVIQDGCGCCNICSRQLGEPCNRRFRCDPEQNLFCNSTSISTPGIAVNGTCTHRPPKSCHVEGKIYEDGEQFQPNCSRLCTCRDGGYGCVSLCPHEEQPPEGSCSNPQLTSVPGQCCKEWTCDAIKPSYTGHSPIKFESTVQSNSEVLSIADTTNVSIERCRDKTTAWSPCSVSCGSGTSQRMTTDLSTCQTVKQTQICYLRPCDLHLVSDTNSDKCSPTVKSHQKMKIAFDGCHSSKALHFRFCGYCGETSVCLPRKIKTVMMDFDCGDNKKRTLNVMRIRSCHCINTERTTDV